MGTTNRACQHDRPKYNPTNISTLETYQPRKISSASSLECKLETFSFLLLLLLCTRVHMYYLQRPGIFGGVELDPLGNGRPTALGKLCRWVETKTESPNAFASYAAYQRTLSLDCAKGHSGEHEFHQKYTQIAFPNYVCIGGEACMQIRKGLNTCVPFLG